MPRVFKTIRTTRPLVRRMAMILGIAIALVLMGTAAAVAWVIRDMPAPDQLFRENIIQSTKIYDRSGAVLLYEIHGEVRRTVIPFSAIPATIKNATVAIEDANFYNHGGIDLRGIMRALLVDVASGTFRQGGSTITQQLVKQSLLGDERTLRRKFKEAVLAVVLDQRLDKDEILGLYLNQIPYGQNAYGIEAAAQTFFGRHAHDLSTAEAALLSALPRAPSYYSPYGQHQAELVKRKDYILERMANQGYLRADETAAAKKEKLAFLPPSGKNIRAPHFVMYVRDYLDKKYGEDTVAEGGLVVTTTIDWKLQGEAEKIVAEGASANEKLIKAHNMALAAIDPKTGGILAMVGSRDYFDIKHDGNFNVATALRQPGSAFKPFVYATAFKKGYTPDTVVFDLPTEFSPSCPADGSGPMPPCYHPGNYDEIFRGPVTFRSAIAQSLNVPSVKVLYLAGIDDSIQTAEDLGISTLQDRSRFGLSLVLGGAEVKLLDMVSAYGAFANDGVLNPSTPILKVETANGRLLEEQVLAARPVLDPEIARTVNDLLSDNHARIGVFQPHSSLYFPDRAVAAKTGTTQDYHDAWTIGYTPTLVAGVWAGNNDNTPIQQKGSGVLAAAPSWHRFMQAALQETPPETFVPPSPALITKPILQGVWQGDTVVTIDTVSGRLATDFTPPEMQKNVAFGTPHDPLYWIDRADPTGPPPSNPGADPQYRNWETSFEQWLAGSGFQELPRSKMPTQYDNVHSPDKQPIISVSKQVNTSGAIVLHIEATPPAVLKELALVGPDGRIVSSYDAPQLPIDIIVPADMLGSDPAHFEVRAYDPVGNIGTVPLTIP